MNAVKDLIYLMCQSFSISGRRKQSMWRASQGKVVLVTGLGARRSWSTLVYGRGAECLQLSFWGPAGQEGVWESQAGNISFRPLWIMWWILYGRIWGKDKTLTADVWVVLPVLRGCRINRSKQKDVKTLNRRIYIVAPCFMKSHEE